MNKAWFEARFYETYYFASIVREVVCDQIKYIRSLHEFYGDGAISSFSRPFPKYSALHSFLEFIVRDLLYESTVHVDLEARQREFQTYARIPGALADLKPDVLPIELALRFYHIDGESFVSVLHEVGKTFAEADEDDVYDYYSELQLSEEFDVLLRQIVREVFLVLFGDRGLMSVS